MWEVLGLRNNWATFFPTQSNNNQQKIKLAELSRETRLVQMTTYASIFADQENNKHFQQRMWLKKSLNTMGIIAAATQIY